MPFPKEFQWVLDTEWAHPVMPKHKSKLWNRLYALPDTTMHTLTTPMVDTLVVALSLAAFIPSEGEGGPKDLTGKKVDTFLKHNFEAFTQTLRAVSANSIMARAAFVWAEKMLKSSKVSKKIKSCFKKDFPCSSLCC